MTYLNWLCIALSLVILRAQESKGGGRVRVLYTHVNSSFNSQLMDIFVETRVKLAIAESKGIPSKD